MRASDIDKNVEQAHGIYNQRVSRKRSYLVSIAKVITTVQALWVIRILQSDTQAVRVF